METEVKSPKAGKCWPRVGAVLALVAALMLGLGAAGEIARVYMLRNAEARRLQNIREALSLLSNPATVVTDVRDIAGDYEQNELSADGHYKGVWTTMHGVVESVGRNREGLAYVALRTGRLVGGVQCFAAPEFERELVSLTAGRQVLAAGIGFGKQLNVLFYDCVFRAL